MRSTRAAGTRSGETSRRLEQAVTRSKRKAGVNLPIEFVRSELNPPEATPLATLLRGGRGGEVRLKLYLCLTLLATAEPHDIREPIRSSWWAGALGLPDPDDNGARRIGKALEWLDKYDYIQLNRRPGRPSTVVLLDPRGGGGAYVGVDKAQRWVRLPLGLWHQEWIVDLSGTGPAHRAGGAHRRRDHTAVPGDRSPRPVRLVGGHLDQSLQGVARPRAPDSRPSPCRSRPGHATDPEHLPVEQDLARRAVVADVRQLLQLARTARPRFPPLPRRRRVPPGKRNRADLSSRLRQSPV